MALVQQEEVGYLVVDMVTVLVGHKVVLEQEVDSGHRVPASGMRSGRPCYARSCPDGRQVLAAMTTRAGGYVS